VFQVTESKVGSSGIIVMKYERAGAISIKATLP
jgi:hypothetical protein